MTPEQEKQLRDARIGPEDNLYPVIAAIHGAAEVFGRVGAKVLEVGERIDRRERRTAAATGLLFSWRAWASGIGIALLCVILAGALGWFGGRWNVVPALNEWVQACSGDAVKVIDGHRKCLVDLGPVVQKP